jgi:hypothetical protein
MLEIPLNLLCRAALVLDSYDLGTTLSEWMFPANLKRGPTAQHCDQPVLLSSLFRLQVTLPDGEMVFCSFVDLQLP